MHPPEPRTRSARESTPPRAAYRPGAGLLRFGEMREAFARGDDTPVDLLERCLQRIDTLDDTVHAFVCLDREGARAAAEASARRYREQRPRSPLDGCPFGVKDIIHSEALPTAMGSPLYAGWRAPVEAACVSALRAAGAIALGKTHTTEFALGESPPTTNPWATQRTPGGSSGGSAAAVGAGMLPLALGTQTVGSILRPASYCGAVGYKPSLGALPMAGIHPLSRTLDHVGPIAASVADAWDAARLMQVAFGGDAAGTSPALDAVDPVPPARLVRLDRIGALERDVEAGAALDALLEQVAGEGVEIVEAADEPELARLESSLERAVEICVAVMRFEARYPLARYLERDPGALGARIRDHLAAGSRISFEDYRRHLVWRERLRTAVASVDADGFVLPASSGPAPDGLALTGSRTLLAPWSLVGGPAWSLPLLCVRGLPQGLQLAGAPGRDVALARIALWLAALGPGLGAVQ